MVKCEVAIQLVFFRNHCRPESQAQNLNERQLTG